MHFKLVYIKLLVNMISHDFFLVSSVSKYLKNICYIILRQFLFKASLQFFNFFVAKCKTAAVKRIITTTL